MPDHSVQISKIPSLKLGNSDIVFDVTMDDEMLGSLRVSKGNLVWRPAGYTHGYWLKWSDFGDLAMEKGKRRKVSF